MNCAAGFVEWHEGVTLAGFKGLGVAMKWNEMQCICNGIATAKPHLKF